MGGEDKTTNQNTSQSESAATPYAPTQPLLDKGFSDALGNYNTMKGAADFGSMFRSGVGNAQGLANYALNSNPLRQSGGVGDLFRTTFGKDGYNDAQRTAMQPMEATARGDFLNLDNPDFQHVLNRAMEDASTEASMVASGMGRSGSDYHQDLVARTVGDLSADARLGQYNLERDRQTQAANSLFGMGQTGMGNVAAAPGVWDAFYGSMTKPAYDLMALGQTPNAALGDLFGAANFGLPFATTRGAQTGSGSVTQPSNTAGKIAGGLLGGASLLFG